VETWASWLALRKRPRTPSFLRLRSASQAHPAIELQPRQSSLAPLPLSVVSCAPPLGSILYDTAEAKAVPRNVRSQLKLTIRAKAHRFEAAVIRLALNEHELGPDVAVVAIVPFAGQWVIEIPASPPGAL
jgi:hypothetical protein